MHQLSHEPGIYGEIFTRAFDRYADRVALIQDGVELTYGQLRDRVSQVEQALRSIGMEAGEGIGSLAPNTVDYVILLIASQVAGLRYTPLHPLGGEEDHEYMLRDSEVKAVVVEPKVYGHRATYFAAQLSDIDLWTLGPHERGRDLFALADSFEPGPLECRVGPERLVGVLYTGGTTGRPKGVMISQRAFVTTTIASLVNYDWAPEPRAIVCTPLSHASGPQLLAPVLHRGGRLIIHDRFDPERFLADTERYRANATWVVPTMIYAMLGVPGGERYDVSSMRTLIHGGGPISPDRLEEALARFGPVFQHVYGQAETMVTTTLAPKDLDPSKPHRFASVGYPMIGCEVAVLDPDGNPVPVGEIGEVCVRSAAVMEGYWKLPKETEEALRLGWKWTGDMGRFDGEGLLYLVDRKSDMIVSGGFNVYPKTVEDALMAHPAVDLAAVIGTPDERWHEMVTAFVQLRVGAEVDADELLDFVKRRRGSLATPKHLEFVDAIPLTPVGKVDRKKLRAPFWEGQDRKI